MRGKTDLVCGLLERAEEIADGGVTPGVAEEKEDECGRSNNQKEKEQGSKH